jgi:tetratricopeptide (TPR) repeat protein
LARHHRFEVRPSSERSRQLAQQIIKGLELSLSPSQAEKLKTDVPVDSVAYEYYLRGVDLYSQNDFLMSIKMLEKSAQIGPDYALTWLYLGKYYEALASLQFGGRQPYDQAQAAFEKAFSIEPSQIEAHTPRANLLTDTGSVERAVPLSRDVLKTNPNLPEAHWELGYAYRFGGMLHDSVTECERARQLDPRVKRNSATINGYRYERAPSWCTYLITSTSDSAIKPSSTMASRNGINVRIFSSESITLTIMGASDENERR